MKYIKGITLLLILLLLSGCNDYRELTDMAIISSIGIDKKDDNYYVTVQVLDTKTQMQSDSAGSTPKIVIYNSKGKTIHSALRNAILESPKKLYAGHIEIVILSEEFAKEGVSDIFDLFLRDAEASKDFKIFIAKDCTIKEIMDVLTPLETIPAENISSSIENAMEIQGNVSKITFDLLVSDILKTGKDAVIPAISIQKIDSSNKQVNPQKRLVLENYIGIFDNDKFLTYINSASSLGYNIISNNTHSSVIPFKCDNTKYASIEITENNSSLSFDTDSQTLKINVNLKGSLSELNCNININNENGIKKLESQLKNEVEKIVNSTIDTEKKYYNSDFLGIELYVFQNKYNFYKNNKNNFKNIIKNMNKEVNVNVKFIQKGIIKEGDEKY